MPSARRGSRGRRRRARASRRGRRSAQSPDARAGDRDDARGELEEPRERDLGRGRVVASATSASSGLRASPPARRGPPSGEWAIRATPLRAALDDSAAERAVVEDAERDLHRRDGRVLERLVQLAAVDVGEPDAPDEAFVEEPRERAHRGPPRRPRIGRVYEIEVDRESVERRQARLAVGANRLRAAVGDPAPPVRDMPPLVTIRAVSAPRRREAERPGQQRLVVVVRAGGVEHGDARLGCGRDRRERALLVAVLVGRQPHAAEADAELRGLEPGQGGQASSFFGARRPCALRERVPAPLRAPRLRFAELGFCARELLAELSLALAALLFAALCCLARAGRLLAPGGGLRRRAGEGREAGCLDLIGQRSAPQRLARVIVGDRATGEISDATAHRLGRALSRPDVRVGDLREQVERALELLERRRVLRIAVELGLPDALGGVGGVARGVRAIAGSAVDGEDHRGRLGRPATAAASSPRPASRSSAASSFRLATNSPARRRGASRPPAAAQSRRHIVPAELQSRSLVRERKCR